MDSITFVTQIRPEDWQNAEEVWESAQDRLTKAINELDKPLPHTEISNALR